MTHQSVNCQALRTNSFCKCLWGKKKLILWLVWTEEILCPDLLVLFPIVHYRLWEGLAVCSAIKRPHRPHAQIVYYITVRFPPLTKQSPHDLSVPLNTNSSVSSLTGSCEWMMNCSRTKRRRPTQSDCWKVLSADMFTLQSRTLPLPRPKSADKWSLQRDARALCAGLWDWRAAGGWVTEEQKRADGGLLGRD